MGLYLGVFLVTLSGLMLEIGLTRIFSATIWYHFAFVAISVALLGWGAGGFVLHVSRARIAFTRERAALLTLLYGLSIPLALWLIVRLPFHPERLPFYFAVSLVPFLLAGMALSMLFAIEKRNAGRLYFADLVGASMGSLLVSGRIRFAQYLEQARERVDPVFDDRPFFFARQKPWGLPRSMQLGFGQILAPILGLCALLLVSGKPRGQPVGPYAASLLFFASLGTGFIAVELSLLQHLTLLLGHPIFTLSILLFTLLASGGLGSASDGRRPLRDVCLAVGVLAAAYALALPRVVPALLPLPLGLRIAIAIAVIAPLGFLMGMPFPRGLRATGQGPFPAPSFYWGLNGIFSVVGSMATMVAAVVAGFTWAMLGGAAFYLLAALASLAFGSAPGDARGASAGRKGEAYGS